MKYRLLTAWVAVVTCLMPLIALAKEDDDTAKLEGRLEGYNVPVRLPESGGSLTWVVIIFLSALTLATLLKNSKRTHLD